MVDTGKDLIDQLMKYDPSLLYFVKIGKGIYQTRISNSSGLKKQFIR
jgi:hypothetical protein